MLAKEHLVLLLCYFLVGLFQVIAGGSRYPGETDEFSTVFFFRRVVITINSTVAEPSGFNSRGKSATSFGLRQFSEFVPGKYTNWHITSMYYLSH